MCDQVEEVVRVWFRRYNDFVEKWRNVSVGNKTTNKHKMSMKIKGLVVHIAGLNGFLD